MTAAQLIATMRREQMVLDAGDVAAAFRFCFERDDQWTMVRLPPRAPEPPPAG